MAEFCKKCFESNFGDMVKDNEKVILGKEKDLCEGCGKLDYTVDRVMEKGFFDSLVEFSEKFGV